MNDIFKFPVSDPEILLSKFQANLGGAEVISVDKVIPYDAADDRKQYNKKCRVIYREKTGGDKFTYMSYQLSGHEKGLFFKEKFLSERDKLGLAVEALEFYGCSENQIPPIYEPTGRPGAGFTSPYRLDKGMRANKALAKIKGLNND